MAETIGFNPEAERSNKVEMIKVELVKANFLKPDEKQEIPDNLRKISDVLGREFKSVSKINEIMSDFENNRGNGSYSEIQYRHAKEDKEILGEAADLAARKLESQDNSLREDFFMGSRHMDNLLPDELKGLGREISKHYITNQEIDKQLNLLEITRQKTDFNNPASAETLLDKTDKTKRKISELDFEDEVSILEQDEALTVLNREKRKHLPVIDSNETNVSENEANVAALIENQHAKDSSKEHRSPYEIDPSSFVDAIFNQDSPRLYFTPAPEWVRKLSSKEQYLLKIEQKLANGAATKLGVKDIDAGKARQNEVYNFPETELKLIYEMPGVKEAMETFVEDLFESYTEDGRVFLRLKLGPDGKQLDPLVSKKCGDIESNFSFENYKEEMFKKMALMKLYPGKIAEINNDWENIYKDTIKNYIKKSKDDFKENKRNIGRTDNRTDAELENKWITDNALEEKRAVATAWNFLFVGNIIESADTKRSLKPSQINSDKIRTMMMPLEKFLQKVSIRKGSLQGSEELFGGSLALWAKRRLEEDGSNFSQKLVYAADNDRTKMTDEQAQWRLMPKRTMCSFNDEYHVKTIVKDNNGVPVLDEKGEVKKEEMTFSEALLRKKEIDFKENDLDVFVSLRDTWDEVISVSPFIIGKGEYSPIQQPEKFSLAVEKLKGLVTGINKIRLTPEEASKTGRIFGHEKYVDCPEFYAWLIANSVGLEINLDTPILNRKTMKANENGYDIAVNGFVRLLNLDANIASRVKKILNGEGYFSSKSAIKQAEIRASRREDQRKREEKRRR